MFEYKKLYFVIEDVFYTYANDFLENAKNCFPKRLLASWDDKHLFPVGIYTIPNIISTSVLNIFDI
jgi:hypothetical protein